MKSRATMLAISLAVLSCTAVTAQDASSYPDRPIRLVVGFSAGGATDTIARLMSDALGQALGQPVVVENMPGANGYIAWTSVASSEPDGYTLLMGENALAIRPSLVKNGPPFDPLVELESIAGIAYSPMVLVAATNVPAQSVQELVEHSRTSDLDFATAGIGTVTHLTGEVVSDGAGIDAVNVHYRGGGPAMNDLLAGHVDINMAAIQVAKPLVEAGSINALAVTGDQRSQALPDVPTLAEAGVTHADVDLRFWYGIFGPRNLPTEVVAKLEEAVDEVLQDPAMAERLATLDVMPAFASGPELHSRLEEEIGNWATFIDEKGITAE